MFHRGLFERSFIKAFVTLLARTPPAWCVLRAGGPRPSQTSNRGPRHETFYSENGFARPSRWLPHLRLPSAAAASGAAAAARRRGHLTAAVTGNVYIRFPQICNGPSFFTNLHYCLFHNLTANVYRIFGRLLGFIRLSAPSHEPRSSVAAISASL